MKVEKYLKVSSTLEFARTWGRMKANRSEEMNYEKVIIIEVVNYI